MNTVAGTAQKALITGPLIGLILVSVSCSALAQISLKYGMGRPAVQAVLGGRTIPIMLAVASSPMVWFGLFLYGFSALMWLFVLARIDVSVAYAFVSLGFLLTMALGFLVLGEPLTLPKLAGTLLIMLGVWLVAGRF
jgi:multidrug transporter EmrE-like cation transporter